MLYCWRLLVRALPRRLATSTKTLPLNVASLLRIHVVKAAVFSGTLTRNAQGGSPRGSLVDCACALPLNAGSSSAGPLSMWPWDGVLWAVPKKRTSHSKKRMRMTHKYLKPKQNAILCPKCGHTKLLHILCGHCLKETLRATAQIRKQQQQREGQEGQHDLGEGQQQEGAAPPQTGGNG